MRSKEGNLNISEIIGRKIQDNPYYDSKNNEKIRLIGFGLIGKKDEETNIFSNKKDEYEIGHIDKLAKYHSDFIFANNEEDAKSLQIKFENEFDFITYILININTKKQLDYLDKMILNRYIFSYKILFVTVS